MFEVRVEADFSAAHQLWGASPKCESLHGHNYRVLAYAQGEDLTEDGLLIDFSILKTALKDVCKTLDHVFLNEFKNDGVSVFGNNPSAERIAEYIFQRLENLLPCEHASQLYAVDVYETSTSRARYKR